MIDFFSDSHELRSLHEFAIQVFLSHLDFFAGLHQELLKHSGVLFNLYALGLQRLLLRHQLAHLHFQLLLLLWSQVDALAGSGAHSQSVELRLLSVELLVELVQHMLLFLHLAIEFLLGKVEGQVIFLFFDFDHFELILGFLKLLTLATILLLQLAEEVLPLVLQVSKLHCFGSTLFARKLDC